MRRGSGPSTSGVFSPSETDSCSEAEDIWAQQLEEISGRLNAENDRTGFLRMINRNNVFNSSNYSLSSLFSMNGSLNSYSLGSIRRQNQAMSSSYQHRAPPLSALYDILIAPMEEFLPHYTNGNNSIKDLTIVLQGRLLICLSMLHAIARLIASQPYPISFVL